MASGDRVRLKFRRDISARWIAENPILADGEPGLDRTNRKIKIGDGVTRWVDLPYYAPGTDSDTDLMIEEHINSELPHPVYDDGPSLTLLYQNAKV